MPIKCYNCFGNFNSSLFITLRLTFFSIQYIYFFHSGDCRISSELLQMHFKQWLESENQNYFNSIEWLNLNIVIIKNNWILITIVIVMINWLIYTFTSQLSHRFQIFGINVVNHYHLRFTKSMSSHDRYTTNFKCN